MSSLRFRLGVFVTAVALALSLLAAVLIGVLQWQDRDSSIVDAVDLAAFQLAETTTGTIPPIDVGVGERPLAVLYGNPPDIVATEGDISDELHQLLIEEIWQFTADDDAAVTVDFDDLDLVAAGAVCLNAEVCDTAIVGVHRVPLSTYLLGRWYWMVAIPAIVAAAAWLTTRWLVGRSLRPVDHMRAELDVITGTDLDRRVLVPGSNDELARLGRSMNATIDRLSAAVTANERFVADAAHELRSPITGVRAALEVEASRADGGLLAASAEELDRAGRLIDDLLTLARRQGRPRPRSDVDLDDMVRAEIDATATRFPDLDIRHDVRPARIEANPDDVRRVIRNLVENACQHGRRTVEVAVEVAIDTTDDGDRRARLRVDDDGPGIPADQRELVFDRFTRLDDSRSRATGGTGLGLAIVRELLADLNGTVTISDSPLGGASFVVTIPAGRRGGSPP